MFQFVRKITITENPVDDTALASATDNVQGDSIASDKSSDISLLPDCWSMRQYDSFKQK